MKILNMSQGAVLGLHAVMCLSKSDGQPVTTQEAAELLKVSPAHLSKIFQRLGKAGLVKALRGPSGGYLLQKAPSAIRLRDVFEALEGPFPMNRCLLSRPRCAWDKCMLGTMLQDVHQIVARQFEKRLSDL